MRISDWSSDVCSSDLLRRVGGPIHDRAVLDILGVDIAFAVDPQPNPVSFRTLFRTLQHAGDAASAFVVRDRRHIWHPYLIVAKAAIVIIGGCPSSSSIH